MGSRDIVDFVTRPCLFHVGCSISLSVRVPWVFVDLVTRSIDSLFGQLMVASARMCILVAGCLGKSVERGRCVSLLRSGALSLGSALPSEVPWVLLLTYSECHPGYSSWDSICVTVLVRNSRVEAMVRVVVRLVAYGAILVHNRTRV